MKRQQSKLLLLFPSAVLTASGSKGISQRKAPLKFFKNEISQNHNGLNPDHCSAFWPSISGEVPYNVLLLLFLQHYFIIRRNKSFRSRFGNYLHIRVASFRVFK